MYQAGELRDFKDKKKITWTMQAKKAMSATRRRESLFVNCILLSQSCELISRQRLP